MTTTRRRRASLYVRLSRQADDSNLSLDGMIDDVRELCRKEGYDEVALHVDDGLTGGYRDRPEFVAWLDDARNGDADVLIAWHVDRMTREGLNVAAALLDVVEGKDPATGRRAHAPVRLIDTRGLDSDHGEAFRIRFVLQAEIARAERERMRDRARSAQRRLRTAGRFPGGTPPYGYTAVDNPDGPGKVLAIVPAEAEAIRECVDRVLSGQPLTRVVRWMNEHGHTPRRANAWSRVTLRQVLVGDAVLGRATVGGKLLRNEEGAPVAPFPAIITLAESLALRDALAVKTPDARKGGRRPARLLSGLLTCHACSAVLQVARRTDGSVTYRCPTKANGGVCAKPVSVSAPVIEEYITDRYLGAVGHLPMMRRRVVVDGVDDLADVEAEIRDTMSEMATAATPELFAKLQKLQARRDELAELPPSRRVELVPTGRTTAEHWEDALIDDRRDMLSDAFEALVLLPGRRGPRGFDPNRLIVRDAEGVQDPDDE